MELIGRKQERETFKHCLNSTESKLIALYGRRRVGKTFLVRKYFQAKIKFEVAGLHNGNMSHQLAHFASTLAKYGWQEAAIYTPDSWKAAFDMLERFIDSMKGKQKKVQLFSRIGANKHKNIFLTMVTTFGVADNEYAKELVQSEVVLENLFME